MPPQPTGRQSFHGPPPGRPPPGIGPNSPHSGMSRGDPPFGAALPRGAPPQGPPPRGPPPTAPRGPPPRGPPPRGSIRMAPPGGQPPGQYLGRQSFHQGK